MTARMYRRCPVRVTASMKSQPGARRPASAGVGPGGGPQVGGRVDALGFQDLPDRGRRHLDPDGGQFAVHAAITSGRILPDQAKDQDADGAHGTRPTWAQRPGGARVTPPYQVAVPAQDRVDPHEQAQSAQRLAGQVCQEGGQESPMLGFELHQDSPSCRCTTVS
jgi:hypothetical protein